MPPTVAALDAALAAQDVRAVIELFAGASEAERRAVAPRALQWARSAIHHAWSIGVPGRPAPEGPPEALRPGAGEPARAAVLAAAAWGDIRKLGTFGIARRDHAYEILVDRRPAWLGSWAKYVCEQAFNTHWLTVRRLEREGLIERPDVSNYWLGMAVNIPFHQWLGHVDPVPERNPVTGSLSFRGGSRPEVAPRSVKQVLLDDPGLLEDHLWRMLEQEDAMARIASADAIASPAVHDGARWGPALAELSREGVLSRDALLEALLHGLGRATQRSARWFSEELEALDPGDDELGARPDSVLRLLGSSVPAALERGFGWTTRLLSAGRLDGARVIDAVGAVLTSRTKAHAISGLRLLELVCEREPTARPQAACAAVASFAHESRAVHERALALLEKHAAGSAPEATATLREKLEQVAPSLRARAERWLTSQGEVRAPPPPWSSLVLEPLEVEAQAVPPPIERWAGLAEAVAFAREETDRLAAVTLDHDDLPHLDPAKRLVSIPDLDDLIDILLKALEGRAQADDAERVIEGLARLSPERPPDFAQRVAPLRRRALDRLTPQGEFHRPAAFQGLRPLDDLAGLVLAWTDGHRFEPLSGPPGRQPWTLQVFLSERLRRVAAAVADRRAVSLLSLPTHRSGWIDPCVVPARWTEARARGQAADLFDEVLCLLRLARERRGMARGEASRVEGEFGAALRYALGGTENPGPTAALWIAAARSRSPYEDDAAVEARHPGLGPAAGRAVTYSVRVARQRRTFGASGDAHFRVEWSPEMKLERRADLPTVLLHLPGFRWDESTLASSWEASVWPSGREAFFSGELNQLATFLESQGAYWQGDWEPLFDPDEPLGPMGRLLVVLGLTARHPAPARLARDALIAAIEDGRLDGTGLGEALAVVLPTDVVAHARWVSAVREAARVSALHLHVLRSGLEAALPALPASPAGRLVACLELLLEWSVEAGASVSEPAARERLRKVQGGGKGARLAQDLLGLEARHSAPSRRQAGVQALSQRLVRARQYLARLSEHGRGASTVDSTARACPTPTSSR